MAPKKNPERSNVEQEMIGAGHAEIPEYYTKKTLVFGCGNILLGDDGFGPNTIEYYIENFPVPADVQFLDVGTGIRNILFDIALSEFKPENIIIIDAVDKDRRPGEIFEIVIEDIPVTKIHDFSVHQIPTINLLKELRDYCNINVLILVCQVEKIPEEVNLGLSPTVKRAIPEMCKLVTKKIENYQYLQKNKA